ncbi:SDR family NAD(P)-dependent oxidoreductase [Corynebacterium crudilactis]|uniref:Oxidoreductase n=1 Tax=Corynebacterium crudilactis TaxID=1652495 RepID=A0A172QUG8_9CORY|nr:SDR family NAD(P)-dependent oxidoreductase [Corynebacterium crudilactis]ANE04334.1 oxidoreductase [Corynebacterium crudilactis]
MIFYDFAGRTAFVTGAGSGMGADTARAFAHAGAAVALVDQEQGALDALTAELTGQGHRVLPVLADITDEDQVAAAVRHTVDMFGSLDMAFNNAGIMHAPVCTADETADAFDQVTAVNLRGVWASMKHELAQMQAQGSGTIVNCSSLGGLVGGAGRASYHAAKHGVLGLTKSAALEYAPLGIRVNAICPGTIDTPMVERMISGGELDLDDALAAIPMARLGRGEEIAAAVLWLASSASSYVTGVALPVDGAYTAQ